MKIRIGEVCVVFLLIWACSPDQVKTGEKGKKRQGDTLMIHHPDSIALKTAEPDCTFDTADYGHTIGALETFQSGINYTWNFKTKEAMAVIDSCDTLYLHIGGCRRFVYSARLLSSIPFDDEYELIEEARWLAVTFFGNGFDLKYDYYISNDYIEPIPGYDSLNFRAFKLDTRDTIYRDMIYTGFSFQKLDNGRRTKITIGGYVN